MEKLLKGVEKYLILTGVALFAVFILPGFPSPFFVPKEIFASIIVSLALIASLVRSIHKGEMKFASGKFDLGVILLMLVYLIASIIKTPNKMEAFFYPGTTTFVILSAIFYLVINQFTKRGKNAVLLALFTSGILLSISILFTSLGVFAKIPQLPAFMKDPGFNPLGSNFQSVIYLLALLPIGIAQIVGEKEAVKRLFFGVASAVLLFGVAISIVSILPGKTQAPILPTWQTSWEITVETLKQSPLFGAGPANYLSAFNLYRPISYNGTNLWQIRFSSANNYYFTLITELGLIGLAALAILLVSIYRKISSDLVKNKAWEEISVAILVVALAFLPVAPAIIFLLLVLLAAFSSSEEKSVTIANSTLPEIIVAAPIILAIIALAFFGTKAVMAEAIYKKSLDALVANDAKNTYNYMVQAEKLNPYIDRYHASLAQVNMALANSLASKKDLTDEDRTTITQLVQQAISEGKATVTLNPGRSGNWEVLGQIYKNIMSFAQGSDQFAIQTYTQAVALDPINPDLRINLGGVYYALGKYDEAINAFQLAIVAKQDLANAHYNLATTYAAKKEYDKAISEMDIVISLVPKDSDDYKTAQTVLDQLKKQRPATEATSQNLTPPETIKPSTNIEPPITLPEEATPPAAP